MRELFVCGLLLAGCGAPEVRDATQTAACHAACAEAQSAWTQVADGAQRAARPDEEREPIVAERVLDRLEEHLRQLEREPREVGGDEAFALSSAVMDAVDAAGSELPERLRERADDAAEALLTDRGRDGAMRAARDAAQVLELVVQAVRPGSIEQRSHRRSLAALERRARSAAAAYRDEGPQRADTRADRAEAIAIPDDAPEALRRAREGAVQASRTVRCDCRIERRLSVPTL